MKTWEQKLNAYFMGFCRKAFRWSPAYKDARNIAAVWCKDGEERQLCAACNEVFDRKATQVDHIEPVVPVTSTGPLSWDTIRDRMGLTGGVLLQVLCKTCHQKKSNAENAGRRECKRKKSV